MWMQLDHNTAQAITLNIVLFLIIPVKKMIASESLSVCQHPLQGSQKYEKSIFKNEHIQSNGFEDKKLAHSATKYKSNVLLSSESTNASLPITALNANDIVNCVNSGVTPTKAAAAEELSKQNSTVYDMSSESGENSQRRLIVSHPTTEVDGFIRVCIDEIIKSAVFKGTSRSEKVVEWHSPEELKLLYDFKLKADCESHEKLLELLKKTINYSVKTGHPYFINQLYCGVDPYALVGQWLTDALNPSVYTYEVAPVFTLMEEEVLSEMREIVGFSNAVGDGIFCPGGSIANGYAISCARYYKCPNSKVRKMKYV